MYDWDAIQKIQEHITWQKTPQINYAISAMENFQEEKVYSASSIIRTSFNRHSIIRSLYFATTFQN